MDSHAFQNGYKLLHDFLWQAVGRDGIGQPSAGLLHALVHSDPITALSQIIGCCQSGGTGSDNGGPLSIFLFWRLHEPLMVFQNIIPHIALHRAYIDTLIVLLPVAFFLTEMGAYPAGDGRHGIGSQDDAGRLVHISFPQLFHIGGDVRMGRTPLCTRSHAHLGCPKDGMVPVLPHHGGAEMSLFSGTVHPSAQAVRIPVVPAPHILTQVAAYGCGVSQVGGCHAFGCLGNHGILLLYKGGTCNGIQCGHCPYEQAAMLLPYIVQAFYSLKADHPFWVFRQNSVSHKVNQVCPAGAGSRMLPL